MFKDYYQILNISQTATLAEIKQAYRALSLKWHPDKNPDKDTTSIMQDINEAYSILKDSVKRQRYDKEYSRFKQTQQGANKKTSYKSTSSQHNSTRNSSYKSTRQNTWTYDYNVSDEQVKSDMEDAREYARKLVDEFLKGLKENTAKAAKGAWDEMKGYIYGAIIITIISLIIMSL